MCMFVLVTFCITTLIYRRYMLKSLGGGGYSECILNTASLEYKIRRPSSARVSYCKHLGDTDLLLFLLLLLVLLLLLARPLSHGLSSILVIFSITFPAH